VFNSVGDVEAFREEKTEIERQVGSEVIKMLPEQVWLQETSAPRLDTQEL